MKRKIVYVKWNDHVSFSNTHWRSEEEYDELKPAVVESVGFVLRESSDHVLIIQNVHLSKEDIEDGDMISGEMLILKAAILEMKEIKVK